MLIGIYVGRENATSRLGPLAEHLKDSVETQGIQTKVSYCCLCKANPEEKLPEIIINHPHPGNTPSCNKGIQKIIEKFPDTIFYIIDFESKRKKDLGKYPNMHYITRENSPEIFTKFRDIKKHYKELTSHQQ